MSRLSKLDGPGWLEFTTGVFVPDENAYQYALERLEQDAEERDAFIEWFYSGNWIHEEGTDSDNYGD